MKYLIIDRHKNKSPHLITRCRTRNYFYASRESNRDLSRENPTGVVRLFKRLRPFGAHLATKFFSFNERRLDFFPINFYRRAHLSYIKVVNNLVINESKVSA